MPWRGKRRSGTGVFQVAWCPRATSHFRAHHFHFTTVPERRQHWCYFVPREQEIQVREYLSPSLPIFPKSGGQFLCRKWELTCLPPWVAKEKIGTLLLASEMPVPISRLPTVFRVSNFNSQCVTPPPPPSPPPPPPSSLRLL